MSAHSIEKEGEILRKIPYPACRRHTPPPSRQSQPLLTVQSDPCLRRMHRQNDSSGLVNDYVAVIHPWKTRGLPDDRQPQSLAASMSKHHPIRTPHALALIVNTGRDGGRRPMRTISLSE